MLALLELGSVPGLGFHASHVKGISRTGYMQQYQATVIPCASALAGDLRATLVTAPALSSARR